MLNWWQNLPSHINPIALSWGPLEIRWYSILYLSAILIGYVVFSHRIRNQGLVRWSQNAASMLNFVIIGIVLGARLGYVLFYEPLSFFSLPLAIIWPFENGQYVGISGLSYHGGAIGFALGLYLACRRYKLPFLAVLRQIVMVVPLGYFFGRIGNFLNLELYGRPTSLSIGMMFPTDPLHLVRFPSQLFEATVEGLFLFLILYWMNKTKWAQNYITSAYLVGYGIIRFLIEFLREPDAFQRLVFGVFSYGQMLSLLTILVGLAFVPIYKYYDKQKN
jgi:phosphatidylglycerol:prolipoprotein diacylglycerol transferase